VRDGVVVTVPIAAVKMLLRLQHRCPARVVFSESTCTSHSSRHAVYVRRISSDFAV